MPAAAPTEVNPELLRKWATELGFQQLGITGVALPDDEAKLQRWLDAGHHGELQYMAAHGSKRSRPAELEPGTLSVLSLRMNYLVEPTDSAQTQLQQPGSAYVSRYALGRDYHKLMRRRLQQLATRMENAIGSFGYRVFVDSAPVLEKALARNAGLGWLGKHTLAMNRDAGSWFFLGEIFTDLPLPADPPQTREHCGSCSACIDICPTQAIIGPWQLDARRCISYLTIEQRGAIPEAFRKPMGNRVFGCDDCQLSCPWNRYAQLSDEADFAPRHNLDSASLAELFAWTEIEFEERSRGMAIRRAGYRGWLRNLAVGLGNAPSTPSVLAALQSRQDDPDELVREHVHWALAQHDNPTYPTGSPNDSTP